MSEIYLAGGCFWGMEKYIASVRGVQDTEVGYANGTTQNPTYEEVCSHTTGHAETVRVVYDAAVVPLSFLLNLYFDAIDPVSVNRQGGDAGTQYRTGIYYTDAGDRPVIDKAIAALAKNIPAHDIEVARWKILPAEEYHQDYLIKTPAGIATLRPKSLQRPPLRW